MSPQHLRRAGELILAFRFGIAAVPFDREGTLRKAEKLLRQGKHVSKRLEQLKVQMSS